MYETKDDCEVSEILALCILLSLSNNIRDTSGRRVHYKETKLCITTHRKGSWEYGPTSFLSK